jgi:hypothetical protein
MTTVQRSPIRGRSANLQRGDAANGEGRQIQPPSPVAPPVPVAPPAPPPVPAPLPVPALQGGGGNMLQQARDAQPVQVPGQIGDVRRAQQIADDIQDLAPNLAGVMRSRGWGALDPNLAALLNAEMIEEARLANEEQIWGPNGLINRLGGAINNTDQRAARAAIDGLLNSNDPFYDRMMRQIQDQYGIQSRDALTAAAQRMGASGRNLSDYQEAMLAQQQRGLMSQAINQNEMARYAAQQSAREKAAQLYMGLSQDMRAQLEQYAQYVAAFPQTSPSFEAFIFPPEYERGDPFNILGMADPTATGRNAPFNIGGAGGAGDELGAQGVEANSWQDQLRLFLEREQRLGGERTRDRPGVGGSQGPNYSYGPCVGGAYASFGPGNSVTYFDCNTHERVEDPAAGIGF